MCLIHRSLRTTKISRSRQTRLCRISRMTIGASALILILRHCYKLTRHQVEPERQKLQKYLEIQQLLSMESLYRLPFCVLQVPNLKIKKPSWFVKPSAMVMFSLILLSYFLVCGGIIYDVIVEPPSVGSTTDEHGHSRPVAFMPYRVNGQYIMEGLASSFLFTLGGLGFIVLDQTHNPSTPKLNRILLISVGFICIIVSFFTCWIFMRMKLPGYLQS